MSSSPDLAISVRGVSKAYTIAHNEKRATTMAEAVMRRVRHPFSEAQNETFWALNDVSFDVQRGEVIGIIGRNGAGKSTLLKILSRITEPTKGEIDLYGRVGSLLEVGTGFHPELTGRENIYLNGGILGMRRSEITRQFDAIVDFAEVEKFLDTPVKRYSSGMYVRLAFAVAAHLNPEILIVDEVLAVGDAEFQNKCLDKMGEIASGGRRTVLFVSHNMSAVSRLCSRVVLMRQGRVALDSTAAEGVRQYLSLAEGGEAFTNPSPNPHADVVITSARLVDPPMGKLTYPQGLSLQVFCRSKAKREFAIELTIRDQNGNALIFLPSELRFGKRFWFEADKETGVTCTIPSLPLAEGRYSIDLSVVISNYSILDQHSGALGFEVINCDPCKTGTPFKQEKLQGSVHVDARFEPIQAAS